MHLRTVVLFSLILSLLMLNACSKEASAKRKLKKFNIEFSGSSLLEQTEKGNIEAVDLLLTAGIDPVKDSTGVGALMLAVKGSHKAIIPLLLSKGVDIKEKDSQGWTPLMHAIESGNKEIVQLLIENSANVNEGTDYEKPLMLAAKKGPDSDIARFLIDKGADINAKNNAGETALMIAAYAGNVELVKLLIKKGSHVNVMDNNEATPLIKAAIVRNAAIVQFLLDNDADVNSKTKDGTTALMHAVRNGDTAIVKALLGRKAKLNEKNEHGVSALLAAALCGHQDIIGLLQEAGAKDNQLMDPPISILVGLSRDDYLVNLFMQCIPESYEESTFFGNIHLKYKRTGVEIVFDKNASTLRSINLYSGDFRDEEHRDDYEMRSGEKFEKYYGVLPKGIEFNFKMKDIRKKLGNPSLIVTDDQVLYKFNKYSIEIIYKDSGIGSIWRIGIWKNPYFLLE